MAKKSSSKKVATKPSKAASGPKKTGKTVTKAAVDKAGKAGKAENKTVSRRTVNEPTAEKKESGKSKNSATLSKLPGTVRSVMTTVETFNSEQKKYYETIRDLYSEFSKKSIIVAFQIGEKLLECQRKFPKSDIAAAICSAANISDSQGRYFRKFSERLTLKEAEMYAELENQFTKWKIPIDTLYKITQRVESANRRKAIVRLVVTEQLGWKTLEKDNSRFPELAATTAEGDDEATPELMTVDAAKKKLFDTFKKETQAVKKLVNVLLQMNVEEELDSAASYLKEIKDEILLNHTLRQGLLDSFDKLTDAIEHSDNDAIISAMTLLKDIIEKAENAENDEEYDDDSDDDDDSSDDDSDDDDDISNEESEEYELDEDSDDEDTDDDEEYDDDDEEYDDDDEEYDDDDEEDED